jgi:hypothetical protein
MWGADLGADHKEKGLARSDLRMFAKFYYVTECIARTSRVCRRRCCCQCKLGPNAPCINQWLKILEISWSRIPRLCATRETKLQIFILHHGGHLLYSLLYFSLLRACITWCKLCTQSHVQLIQVELFAVESNKVPTI